MSEHMNELFRQVFGVDPVAKNEHDIHWAPGLKDLIHCDTANSRFLIEISDLSEEKQTKFIKDLNELIAEKTGKDRKSVADVTLVNEQGRVYAAVGFAALSVHSENLIPEKIKEREWWSGRLFELYYKEVMNAELTRLPREAFNIDLLNNKEREERWGRGRMIYRDIPRQDKDGREYNDLVLCIDTDNGPATGYDLLADYIDEAVHKTVQFLQGSEFITPEQQEQLDAIFGPDRNESIIVRIPLENFTTDQYLLAIDAGKAKAMVKAGLFVDLSYIIDRHMHFYNGAGYNVPRRSDEESAVKALQNRLNLVSLMTRDGGQTIMRFQGTNTFGEAVDVRTGRQSKLMEEFYAANGRYEVVMNFPYLTKSEAAELSSDLNNEITPALQAAGVNDLPPLFAAVKSYDGWDVRASYDFVDLMLRKNITVDALPIVQKYSSIQQNRVDEANAVLQSLADTVGYNGWSDFGFMEELFMDNKNSMELFLMLGRGRFRVAEDSPENLLSGYRDELKKIIEQAGLSGEMNFNCVGDKEGHFLGFKFKVKSLGQVQDVARKFAAFKDQIKPIVKDVLSRSAFEVIFNYRTFGDEYERIIQEMKRPISAIEWLSQEKAEGEVMNGDRYFKAIDTPGNYIAYLAAAEKSENPEIRELAGRQIAYVAMLAPVLAELVVEAQKTARPLTKPVIPPPAPQGMA